MMSENKNGSRTLRMLLLMCAGALLVIVITLASEVYIASREASAPRQINDTCRSVAKYTTYVPAGCEQLSELELQ
jgi:hypothetical protein